MSFIYYYHWLLYKQYFGRTGWVYSIESDGVHLCENISTFVDSSKHSSPANEKGSKSKSLRDCHWKHAVCDNRKQAYSGDSSEKAHHANFANHCLLMNQEILDNAKE